VSGYTYIIHKHINIYTYIVILYVHKIYRCTHTLSCYLYIKYSITIRKILYIDHMLYIYLNIYTYIYIYTYIVMSCIYQITAWQYDCHATFVMHMTWQCMCIYMYVYIFIYMYNMWSIYRMACHTYIKYSIAMSYAYHNVICTMSYQIYHITMSYVSQCRMTLWCYIWYTYDMKFYIRHCDTYAYHNVVYWIIYIYIYIYICIYIYTYIHT